MNLVVSALLVAGWSAFAAVSVRGSADGVPLWTTGVLLVIGLLSSYVAFVVTTEFYRGGVYKVVNLPWALVSYLLCSIWPAAGQAAYGWFFALF